MPLLGVDRDNGGGSDVIAPLEAFLARTIIRVERIALGQR